MARPRALLDRLFRVLELAELLLRELVGGPPSAALFSEHRAFRWDAQRGPGRLVPIGSPAEFELDDLIGVDASVARLIANTEQLLAGLPFNNALLHGERGTGKSSAVRGLLTRYGERGLRLVEVQKGELAHLPDILGALRGAAPGYSFLIFCDDLSFGIGETGFRELKAALEGSLEAPPANVCIVATSNRRHLLPETVAENRAVRVDEEGELHVGEALEEKLALSDRFGLVLGFYSFDQKTYLEIVDQYLRQQLEGTELSIEGEELSIEGEESDEVRREALRWALARASRSGRTARQFAADYAGRRLLASRRV